MSTPRVRVEAQVFYRAYDDAGDTINSGSSAPWVQHMLPGDCMRITWTLACNSDGAKEESRFAYVFATLRWTYYAIKRRLF